MLIVDLSYPLLGGQIPADHGYLLYSAISRLLPVTHQADGFGIHPIRGWQLGVRTLRLTKHSRLVIRTDVEHIARFLPLAGKQLRILGSTLRIGVPQTQSLVPAPALRSRLVTIKLRDAMAMPTDAAAETFRAAALRKLEGIGISGA